MCRNYLEAQKQRNVRPRSSVKQVLPLSCINKKTLHVISTEETAKNENGLASNGVALNEILPLSEITKKFQESRYFDVYSQTKTLASILHFTKLLIPPPLELRLGNIRIQKSETVKYLGLVFDSKLDWKAHIQQLKSKCNKALNLMRSVSSTEWGADHKTLIMICRSLMKSKIDYGCIVYNCESSCM